MGREEGKPSSLQRLGSRHIPEGGGTEEATPSAAGGVGECAWVLASSQREGEVKKWAGQLCRWRVLKHLPGGRSSGKDGWVILLKGQLLLPTPSTTFGGPAF